jgi:hypothetical protein
VANAAIVTGQQGGGGRVDDGGLAVLAGEGYDRFKGLPERDNQDFHGISGGAGQNLSRDVARNALELRQNVLREIFDVSVRQLTCRSSGPKTRDHFQEFCRRRGFRQQCIASEETKAPRLGETRAHARLPQNKSYEHRGRLGAALRIWRRDDKIIAGARQQQLAAMLEHLQLAGNLHKLLLLLG